MNGAFMQTRYNSIPSNATHRSPTHRQDIMIAARREPPPPPPVSHTLSSFPHAWGTYTYGQHQYDQMAVQLIPRRTSCFSTPLKRRAQVACPRQTSRAHCKRCVSYFSCFKKERKRNSCFLPGRRREGRSGPADNVRGACSWLSRTYHVRVVLSLHHVRFPSPPSPFPSTDGVTDSRKRMLDG